MGRRCWAGAIVVLGVVLLASCTWPIAPPPTLWSPPDGLPSINHAYLEEPTADGGVGQSFVLTSADAEFSVGEQSHGEIIIQAANDRTIRGDLRPPEGTTFAEGFYGNAKRFPAPEDTWLEWSTFAPYGCNTTSGWFVIDHLGRDDAGKLDALDVRVHMTCDGGNGIEWPINSSIHWSADDTTVPPGPVTPPPSRWSPPAAAIPSTGNFLYVESDPNTAGLQGNRELFTATETDFTVTTQWKTTTAAFRSPFDEGSLTLKPMSSRTRLEKGYYDADPLSGSPTKGQLAFSLAHYSCEGRGWFIVDDVTYRNVGYVGFELTSIDVRFARGCQGETRGRLRWSATDTSHPAAPVVPAPYRAWKSLPFDTPNVGNHLVLERYSGDAGGTKRNTVFTGATHTIAARANQGGVDVTVTGPGGWSGSIRPMAPLTRLQPGAYASLVPLGSADRTVGAMAWTGDTPCPLDDGWFIVDSVSYRPDGSLLALDLRFEQRCPTTVGEIRGQLHYVAGDTSLPPGVAPRPATLWQPPVGAVPASGNALYLASDPGDSVGGGRTRLLTPPTSSFHAENIGNRLVVVTTDPAGGAHDGFIELPYWVDEVREGNFFTFTPGMDPVGLDDQNLGWTDASGARCPNTGYGWVSIDRATFAGNQLVDLRARFELRCAPGAPALHGLVQWHA